MTEIILTDDDDTFYVPDFPFGLKVFGRQGDDYLEGGHEDNYLDGDAGNDWLVGLWGRDTLVGDVGNDRLYGDWDDDFLFGGPGNDQLDGAWGNDVLLGGSGDDRLDGGYDADSLTGGAGADVFALDYAFLSAPGWSTRDTLTDFDREDGDRIDLSAMDANVQRPGNQRFKWVGDDATLDAGELGFHRSGADVIVRGAIGPTDDDGGGYFELELEALGGRPRAADFDL